MRAAQLDELAAELGLDVVGAAPAEPYAATEHHIHERRARGLFADMRFTMAQPEVSCHPETLLPGARTVVSAALCYYAPAGELESGEGRLARYTWSDRYAELREKLDALGGRLGGSYRVLVDANQHVDREGAARSGVGFYGKNTLLITRSYGSWVALGTLVTDCELEPTAPLGLDCGTCTLCIEACPTGALDDRSTDATSARTSAPGTAASRSGERERHYRPERSRTSRSSSGSRPPTRSSLRVMTVCLSRRTIRATCGGTHSSHSVTQAARSTPG